LLIGATLDGANELARAVAKEKGVAFGGHRLSFSQLAAVIAAPMLATRGLVPLSRVGTEAIVSGFVRRLRAEGRLSRYHAVSDTPGFPRAITNVIAELRSANCSQAPWRTMRRIWCRSSAHMNAYSHRVASARAVHSKLVRD
jgi:hypothetical protein